MGAIGLQNLSSYSLLQSPIKVKDLAQKAKDRGYEAIALTDINVTYGLVEFYKAAKEVGIKPILGMQARFNGLIDQAHLYDLIVLAKTNQGFENILRLSSAINLLTNNGEAKKVLSFDELKKYFKDLIVIVPANTHSELLTLHQQNQSLASDYLRQLKTALPTSSELYLGVYANKAKQNYINFVRGLSQQFELPLVATEDVQYLNPRDQFLQKSLLAIGDNSHLQDVEQLAKQAGSHYLKSSTELVSDYHQLDLEDALTNSKKISDKLNAQVTFKEPELPKFKQEKFPTSKEYLHHLAQTGLAKRFKNGKIPVNYQKRLDYELQVINQMGFDDYFLIVWDVMNFAHAVDITTGPGRGSAAGSLVAYALRITEVDPLKYNLLFERFLNPARQQMPDIDLDIPDNRREEVIQYMFHKYGMDHAAQILTFGTLAAKQALRDVGRVFGLNKFEMKKWTQAIPYSKTQITLDRAFQESKDLQLLVNNSTFNQLLFATAKHLEGLPRHYSIHAAGLVLTDDSIASIAGLQASGEGIPVTQQTKLNVEDLGLLKIDFLGLRNLTILGNTLALLKNEGIKLDPHKIPLNDPATLKLFQEGQTDAVFQFESDGIKNVLRRLHPDNFEDIVAVNALYRPGPMQNINHFIDRKHGKEAITYPDPSLKEILSPTYGILVYQEQVMQTAQVLAGFSLGEADLLRRAMSKKNLTTMQKQREKFITGAVNLGRPKQVAEKVYDYIGQFANYGFNRSHAVAYSEIAFWLAYLKVHYPAAFYTALLNSNLGNRNKVNSFLTQVQSLGIKVKGPDINEASKEFTLKNNQIIVGFRAIRGLRNDLIDEILQLKKPVKSLSDFLLKIDPKFLSQDAIDNLIKVGVFDSLEANRNNLLAISSDLVDTVKMSGNNTSLFETLEPKPVDVTPPTNSEKAQMEDEIMGFATTMNPLIAVQKYARRFGAKVLKDFGINEEGVGVGKLIKLKPIRTKKGDVMAFATFADSQGEAEFTIFPKSYEKLDPILKIGQIYLLQVRTQADRYDQTKKQYLLTSAKQVNYQE